MSGDTRRAALAAALAAHQPVDARERRSIDRFLAELERLRRPFSRDAGPTHVTASAIVIGARGVVLHRHRRLGIWLQPGGHLDEGEEPAACALREAGEETGLRLRLRSAGLVHVDVHPAALGHVHLDLRYALEAADGAGDEDPAPPPGESQEVRWFGWEEAVAIADEGLVGALRRLRPGGPAGAAGAGILPAKRPPAG